MKLFVFSEISIGKCCYRLFRVVAKDEEHARQILPDWGFGVALIGSQETRSKKLGYRTSLMRDGDGQPQLGAFKALCKKFGTTSTKVHQKMSKALQT